MKFLLHLVIFAVVGSAAHDPRLASAQERPRKTFFVSAQGDDRSTGTSQNASWRSLARISNENLAPGDCVLLRRGDAWQEMLIPPTSGTADQPICFGAYGKGSRPVLDGRALGLKQGQGIVNVYYRKYIEVRSLEIRNSAADGMIAYVSDGFKAIDDVVHDSQDDGIAVDACSEVVLRNNETFNNNLSASGGFSGMAIDNSRGEESHNILIEFNRTHHNIGSPQNNGNGIKIGHTGDKIATIHALVIRGNEVFVNGNTAQNQFGRGITASVNGDMLLEFNCIHDNASAGAYIGGIGYHFNLIYSKNVFVNNHLRGFGWIGDGQVQAIENIVLCNQKGLTCVGTEFGGSAENSETSEAISII